MDLWEKRTHQFSNKNLQKPHLQLLEVILFASFHLLPHNVQFGTTRSPHPLTWTSCWVSKVAESPWNPGGQTAVKLQGRVRFKSFLLGVFGKQKNCKKNPMIVFSCWKENNENKHHFNWQCFQQDFKHPPPSSSGRRLSTACDPMESASTAKRRCRRSWGWVKASWWTTTTYLEDHPRTWIRGW